MVDFIEAFKQGQTAAEKAKNNHQEIDSVFEQLNEQLAKATEGKIQLSIEGFAGAVVEGDEGESLWRPSHWEICAGNNELAEWEKGREGYPCKITIGNKQHYCEDKTELEETLALMLQDPIVAGILADVMRLSDKQAA
jgi:hypothetical protein